MRDGQSGDLPGDDLAKTVRNCFIVAIAYYLGAEIAFLVGTLSDRIFAPFWPPNVVLFCALVLTPPRQWWIYIVAVLPAHIAAELRVGMPATQLLVAFVTNCSVAVINAFALRWLKVEISLVRHDPQGDGLCFRHRVRWSGSLCFRRCIRSNSRWRFH